MKKSELQQFIKEEINNIMDTKNDGASGYGEVMRKFTDKITGGRIPDLTVKNTYKKEFPATIAKRELEKLRPKIEAIANDAKLDTKEKKENAYNELFKEYDDEVKKYMHRAISGALLRQHLNK